MIKTRETVKWVSQAQGGYTEKKGTVIDIIKSGESAMRLVPETAKKSHIKFQDKSQMERVLVEVPAGKDGSIKHYYCPLKSVLEAQRN